jgi:hypothetical protein
MVQRKEAAAIRREIGCLIELILVPDTYALVATSTTSSVC